MFMAWIPDKWAWIVLRGLLGLSWQARARREEEVVREFKATACIPVRKLELGSYTRRQLV